MSEMKRGPQWNTLILSAGPTSCKNLHCSIIYPQNSWEPDATRLRSGVDSAQIVFHLRIPFRVLCSQNSVKPPARPSRYLPPPRRLELRPPCRVAACG